MMPVDELNIDGLVGPSHHYAGLAPGNLASTSNALRVSNPAAAAHQGIEKMRLLHHLGLKQAFMPPHLRPNLHLLHRLGFTGTPSEQIQKAYRADPHLLSAAYSASSMWTANCATVSPSQDTKDHRVHFTPANLISHLHRQQETDTSMMLLKQLFSDERYFHHHAPLPSTVTLGDEGAANHSRLCQTHSTPGVHLFVYGKQALPADASPGPLHFPARQTLEASSAIARLHQLNPKHVVMACLNPQAIDQGVFHSDVIAVANESVLLIHEEALLHQTAVLKELQLKLPFPLKIIEVDKQQISIKDAVKSYLFNSQLVTLKDHTMALIAPIECEEHARIKTFIADLIEDPSNPISQVHYLSLKQSMRNGGGPACLRLRVPLNEQELSAMNQGVLVNEAMLNRLDLWVDKHYRTHLRADDLKDPALLNECLSAFESLNTLLYGLKI